MIQVSPETLNELEDNHYIYCRNVNQLFFEERKFKNIAPNKQVFLLFCRKKALLKELLKKFDKTLKEHHIRNTMFFRVKEIGVSFNDAFAAVTFPNVI